jgi:Zn-dependent protease with chaperone function
MNPSTITTPSDAEAVFKQANRRSIVFFIITLCFLAYCTFEYFTTTNGAFRTCLKVFFWISLGCWILISMVVLWSSENDSEELEKVEAERIGKFSLKQVKDIFAEVFSNTPGFEKPKVFISYMEVLNSWVFNTLFNQYQHTNAVYMTELCFKKLTENEIKAILYHEMAHFRKYIYMENRTLNFSMFFFFLMPFAFTALVPFILLKIVYVVFAFVAVLYLWAKIRAVNDLEAHALEFLCDLEATKHVGKLNMINALIAITRENEPIIQKSKSMKDKVQKVVKPPKPRIPVDWAHFDTHVVNGKIEPEELDALHRTLESVENPELMNAELDKDASSHPSLSKRVLFLCRYGHS